MKFSTTAILVTALLASSAEAANRHAGTRRTPTPAVAPSVDEARSAAILQRRALSADYVDVGPHHVAPRRRMKVVRRNSADKQQQQQQPQRRVAAFGAIPVVGAGTQPIVGLVQRDVDRHDGKQGSSYTGNADWTDTATASATATATATDAEVDLAQQSGSQSHSWGSGSGSGSWGTKSWGSGSGSGSWSKGSGSGSYATATAVAASSANDDDSAEATATAVASSTSTDDDDDDDDEDCDDDDDDDDDEDCDDDEDDDEDDDDSSDSTTTAAATGTATAAVEDAAYGSWGGKSWSKTASYAQVTDSQSGSSASASASASSTASADGTTYTGIATWFTQNGVAGACGTVHADSDKVIALYTSVYGSGGNCGRTVSITNLDNGESTTATVADECPTCGGAQDIDLSIGTFSAIDSNYASDGTRNIEWYFTS